MTDVSEFVVGAFATFVTWSLYNLGEDFSSSKKSTDTGSHENHESHESHEKPPLPLGMLLMFLVVIIIGSCVALLFLATWYYFLGVVPTKMMVLSDKQDDEELRRPKVWQLRWQLSQFRSNLLRPSNRELMQGALYVFFIFNWLSDVVARPFSPGLHQSVVYVLAAMVLCPLQLVATALSIPFPSLFSPQRAALNRPSPEKGEKAPSPSTVKDPVPRLPRKRLFLAILEIYRWQLPTIVLWATACELAKLPPLALSRVYSLKNRVQSMEVHYALSDPSLHSLLLDLALVFLVYAVACLVLILPTTIAMRRTHASWNHFSERIEPVDESIRGRTDIAEREYLGLFEALRTFSWSQAARIVASYGPAYCVMQVVKSVGFGVLLLWIKFMESQYGSTEQYMGIWKTLLWFFQHLLFWK